MTIVYVNVMWKTSDVCKYNTEVHYVWKCNIGRLLCM